MGTVVLLAVVVLVVMTGGQDSLEVDPLVIAAVGAEKGQAQDGEAGAEETRGPANRIVIKRGGKELVLEKGALDTWRITSPFVARADTAAVEKMLEVFKTETGSSFARKSGDKWLERSGLTDDERIDVALYKGDERLVDIRVGFVLGEGEGDVKDTWVMRSDGDVIYRMKGKDLRSPFEVDLSQLRDKKLYSFLPDDVTALVLESSEKTRAPRLVLEKHEKPGGSDEKKKEIEWLLTDPAGYPVRDIESLARRVANATVLEYIEEDIGANRDGFEKPFRLTASVTPEQGKGEPGEVVIEIGGQKGEDFFAKVSGGSGYQGYVLLSKSSAEGFIKKLSDLRHRKIFDAKKDDIARVEVRARDRLPIRVSGTGANWAVHEPAGLLTSAEKMDKIRTNISVKTAKEFLEEDPAEEVTGLGEGAASLTIGMSPQAGGGSFTLLLGNPVPPKEGELGEAQEYYARLSSAPDVFTLSKDTYEKLLPGLDDFRDNRLFHFEEKDVSAVVFSWPGEADLVLEKVGEQWNVTAPETVENVGGAATEIVSNLPKLAEDGLMEGLTTETAEFLKKGAVTVTARLAAGSSLSVRLAEERQDKTDEDGTTVTKVAGTTDSVESLKGKVFYLENTPRAEKFFKKLPDFKK